MFFVLGRLTIHFSPIIVHACNLTRFAWRIHTPIGVGPPLGLRFLHTTGSLQLSCGSIPTPTRVQYLGWPGLFVGPDHAVMEPWDVPYPYP